jgi:RNA polymerase sigma-70 factor (ECF subfamily)
MNSREQNWAEAMRAARRGDSAAYERLLSEIADVVRGLIRWRLGRLGLSAHVTEDLVQEVLIGLHTKRHTWDAERPFLPWLNAIARHKLADAARQLRREARHRCELTPEQWSTLFEPSEDTDRTLIDLDRHLNSLPAGQQEVVRALAIEGASVRTTAQRLHISEGAVRMTLHRALERLTAAANLGRAQPIRGKA